MTSHSFHIAPRVLDLCQKPRTVAEIQEAFAGTERDLARYAVYNLVKRGLLRNVNPGQHGWGKRGRFVCADSTDTGDCKARRITSDGRDLARAWGLPC
jgi:hypothetical protein